MCRQIIDVSDLVGRGWQLWCRYRQAGSPCRCHCTGAIVDRSSCLQTKLCSGMLRPCAQVRTQKQVLYRSDERDLACCRGHPIRVLTWMHRHSEKVRQSAPTQSVCVAINTLSREFCRETVRLVLAKPQLAHGDGQCTAPRPTIARGALQTVEASWSRSQRGCTVNGKVLARTAAGTTAHHKSSDSKAGERLSSLI